MNIIFQTLPRKTILVFAIAFALATLILEHKPSCAPAASNDASAITAFLKIGLREATANFNNIRGASISQGSYEATRWPDHTHFSHCFVQDVSESNGDVPNAGSSYLYGCYSTPRANNTALFKMLERTVRATLPSAYISAGKELDEHGLPIEIWKRSAPYQSVGINLVKKGQGKVSYFIAVRSVLRQ
jgi:hypothetical protein